MPQNAVSEEANTLVKYRTGLTVAVEVGWRRKKTIDLRDGCKIYIFVKTGHRVLTVRPFHSAHDDQPRSLHNNIKCCQRQHS